MAKWVDLGPVEDFAACKQKSVQAEGVPVAVFNVEGKHFAIADICPHAGMPLGHGEVCNKVVTCPFHGYAYNIETGKNVDFPDQEPPVRTYPVRVAESGMLQVNLRPDQP
ncbi:MAG: Rieske 2Fe-2S domain-containing protein [Phycisphaeraceae bacterium]|nr:Rieske 2Fe-2S domain-containing protein [Phycisphaeraceae bacterium]